MNSIKQKTSITHIFKLRFFYLTTLFFFFSINSMANPFLSSEKSIQEKDLKSKLEKIIPDLMEKAGIPGLSIAVIREGAIYYTQGFGIKNTQTEEPVSKDTIFEAASLTKPLFAYAALRMVDERLIELDIPLINYLPLEIVEKKILRHSINKEGFRKDWFRKITARLVLSHSAGMPHGERGEVYPLLFEPGSKYKYSSQGYWYLQLVIEHLKKDNLASIIDQYVLKPLGMTQSCMIWKEAYNSQAAVGHDILGETNGKFRKRKKAHSAASLYTTAEDYSRFVIAVMNGTGLKEKTFDQMLSPQIDVDKNIFWGLGFGLQNIASENAFWQWGDYGIFRNYIIAFKKQKSGLVYLTNSFNGLSIGHELVKKIMELDDLAIKYLGYDHYNSSNMLFIREAKQREWKNMNDLLTEFRTKYHDRYNENGINSLAYLLLNNNKDEEAIILFKQNIKDYPLSANTYDSLAEAYFISRKYKLSYDFYNKALKTLTNDPNPDKNFLSNLKKGILEQLKSIERKLQKEKKQDKKPKTF